MNARMLTLLDHAAALRPYVILPPELGRPTLGGPPFGGGPTAPAAVPAWVPPGLPEWYGPGAGTRPSGSGWS